MIGFGFTSDWLKKWHEFCQPITKRYNAKPKQSENYFRHSIKNRSILTLCVIYHNVILLQRICKILQEQGEVSSAKTTNEGLERGLLQ